MKPRALFHYIIFWTALVLSALSAHASEDENGVKFSGSGFLTVAAGRILGGDAAQDFNGYQAPLFVADFGQGGVYEGHSWSLAPVSKLGLQGTATFSPQWSFTGQIVSRGAENGRINFEWAYLNYNWSNQLSLQLGRKRLPLFYYSETQDVGFSYPWVHLPTAQYGWEVVNFNGANLRYQTQWDAWSSSMEIFTGSEYRADNKYWKIYNGRDTRTDSRWDNIIGADITLTRDWLDTRFAYIESDIQNRTVPADFSAKVRQKIYSYSLMIDYQHWVMRNEYLYMDRRGAGEEDFAWLVGLGYRIDKWLPMFTFGKYYQNLIDPTLVEAWSVRTWSVNYALTSTSDIKLQYDQFIDQNGVGFNGGVAYGNPRLLSASYDLVF